MPPRIDEYSLSTIPVQQLFNSTELGVATAFIFKRRGVNYLVTNWHVATCRNFETGETLRPKDGARPNKLVGMFAEHGPSLEKYARDISLWDEHDQPLWLIHPVHGHSIDVVAIQLPAADRKIWYHPINEMNRLDLNVQVGMDVFVLGYPFGAQPPYLPVWKRGSIASEPQLVRIGHKFQLIDSASRPGSLAGRSSCGATAVI